MSKFVNREELAKLVGTTQSVISRMENADYAGHSIFMLTRIAKAINRRITVQIPADRLVWKEDWFYG